MKKAKNKILKKDLKALEKKAQMLESLVKSLLLIGFSQSEIAAYIGKSRMTCRLYIENFKQMKTNRNLRQ